MSVVLATGRSNGTNALREAATIYNVGDDAVAPKVKQEFAAKAKAKKEAKSATLGTGKVRQAALTPWGAASFPHFAGITGSSPGGRTTFRVRYETRHRRYIGDFLFLRSVRNRPVEFRLSAVLPSFSRPLEPSPLASGCKPLPQG